MDINWQTVFVSIGSSSVLAAVITLIGNNYIKRNEFNWDYRKYILDKRKTAYDKLEIIINELLQKINFNVKNTSDKTGYYLQILSDKTQLEEYMNKISEAIQQSYWYSENICKYLKELYEELAFHYYEHDKINELTKASGISFFDDRNDILKNLYRQISKQYMNDIKKLCYTNSFKKFQNSENKLVQ